MSVVNDEQKRCCWPGCTERRKGKNIAYCTTHNSEYGRRWRRRKAAEEGRTIAERPQYRRHGCTNEPWFRSYEAMVRRASGKHGAHCYEHVDICDAWKNDPQVFGAWALANGFQPGLSVDRIDPDKGYFPENCRWLSLSDNVRRSHTSKPRRHGVDGRFIAGPVTTADGEDA